MSDTIETANRQLAEVEDRLLVLRLSLGKFRAALERAFAPVAAAMAPALTGIVRHLTDLANDAAYVLTDLFGLVRRKADTTTRYTARALRRSLADFDQLDRLDAPGGGSYAVTVPGEVLKLPDRLRPVVERIRTLLEPLGKISLQPLIDAFGRLRQALEPITRSLFSALEWAWFNLLVPMSQWAVEQALPAFLDALSAALQVLDGVIQSARPVLSWMWESILRPMAQWTGQALLEGLTQFTNLLNLIGSGLAWVQPKVEGFVSGIGAIRQGFFGAIDALNLWQSQSGPLGLGLGSLGSLVRGLAEGFRLVSDAAVTAHSRMVTLFQNLEPSFRSLANAAIALINGAIGAVEAGINSMVDILNTVQIKIPAWVPKIGGEKFGVDIAAVRLPKVPYLAQGAVLPANAPFLAVVGDQRRGTNVEAPLATIQEAVAQVLAPSLTTQDSANALLSQILAAVLNLRVGDEVIGRAARRYENRLAVMGGGL